MEELGARRLQVAVDKANEAYGHGMARTNDFGFAAGDNMCRTVPVDVRARLHQLQKQASP